MNTPLSLNRRHFLGRLMRGCAVALAGSFTARMFTEPLDADSVLALRVARAAGTLPAPPGIVTTALQSSPNITVSALLSAIFAVFDFTAAARLDTAQLQQLLVERIQQDYQQGTLVNVGGWWLARSEAAILQLRNLLLARGVRF